VSALAIVTLAAGFPSATVSAAPPSAVVLQLHPCSFTPEIGTWEGSGAIGDSGSYERTEAAVSPPSLGFLQPGTLRETFMLSGAQGTLTIKAEERLKGTPLVQAGVWQIVAGTGTYSDASGHGEDIAFFTTPPVNSCPPGTFRTFTFSLSGVASKVIASP
jgi:hypothetical protein